jgi:hypothetical protein
MGKRVAVLLKVWVGKPLDDIIAVYWLVMGITGWELNSVEQRICEWKNVWVSYCVRYMRREIQPVWCIHSTSE